MHKYIKGKDYKIVSWKEGNTLKFKIVISTGGFARYNRLFAIGDLRGYYYTFV